MLQQEGNICDQSATEQYCGNFLSGHYYRRILKHCMHSQTHNFLWLHHSCQILRCSHRRYKNCSPLLDYILSRRTAKGTLPEKPMAVKTIVTTVNCKVACYNMISVENGMCPVGAVHYGIPLQRYIFTTM